MFISIYVLRFIKAYIKHMFRLEKRKNTFKPGFPAGIYLLKVNKRNARKRYEICSKLTIKTSMTQMVSFLYLYC